MVNHVECGKLECKILRYLALNPNSLIQPTAKAVYSAYAPNYATVFDAFVNLRKRGYVEPGDKVKSEKNVTLQGYRLTRDGLLYVFSHNNIDFQKVLELYGEGNEFLREYKRLYSVLPNKKLLSFLIKEASRYALRYQHVDNVMDNPHALLKATIDLESAYGQRPEDEKDCLKNLTGSIEAAIKTDSELSRIYEKRKKALKCLRKTIEKGNVN